MNKCIIYDEGSRAQSTHYKSLSEKRGKQLNRGKSYSVLDDKGKHRISDGRRPNVREASVPINYYMCGGAEHHTN